MLTTSLSPAPILVSGKMAAANSRLFAAAYEGHAMSDMMTQEGPSAVYLAARREWNERYGTHISRERWWRAAALLAITANVALSGELAWKAHQSSVVPYVVAVDKLGESVAVHRLPVAPPVDALRIRAQLARWISDIRSVYSDPLAERNVATEAYEWVDLYSDGKAQLDAWFRSRPKPTSVPRRRPSASRSSPSAR